MFTLESVVSLWTFILYLWHQLLPQSQRGGWWYYCDKRPVLTKNQPIDHYTI